MAAGLFDDLRELAESQGWAVTIRQNGHLRWESPTGEVVYSSSSPSDRKAALHRHRRLLVAAGLRVPQKGSRRR